MSDQERLARAEAKRKRRFDRKPGFSSYADRNLVEEERQLWLMRRAWEQAALDEWKKSRPRRGRRRGT